MRYSPNPFPIQSRTRKISAGLPISAIPNDYDYAYYVTAHELAHQWWGHQVSPNATRGANLISESLAEYSALMIAKQKYGPDNVQRFLKYDLDAYLRGRAGERQKRKRIHQLQPAISVVPERKYYSCTPCRITSVKPN
jgi:aminopeptidase N